MAFTEREKAILEHGGWSRLERRERNRALARARHARRQAALEQRRLDAETPLASAVTADRDKRVYHHCEFCGAPCYGRACRSHRDLLDVDPLQQLRGVTPVEEIERPGSLHLDSDARAGAKEVSV